MLALTLAAAASVLVGCSGRSLSVSPTAHVAPPIEIDSSDLTYTFVMDAPTAGWTMEHVGTRELFKRREVFVLIREPNPVFFYPQAIVKQHLGTDVRTDLPIDLHAAVIRHDASWPSGGFGFAATDEGNPNRTRTPNRALPAASDGDTPDDSSSE